MNNHQIYQGHLARKRFRQHFLTSKFVISRTISEINPQEDQVMVEIGPGLAALTEPISKYVNKLIVIELDRDLVARLRTHPSLGKKIMIYQQDAISVNFKELSIKIGKPLRIFGNLPYNISTPLIFHLFKYTNCIVDMHFMLQKEVANRLTAQPNSKAYGRLSIMAQYFCNITSVFEVSPVSFVPPPKVDSAIVRLVPYKTMPYQVHDLRILAHITTSAFNQRRKTIRNSLKNLFTVKVLEKIGIDPNMRAENISIEQYCKQANYISNNISLLKEP